MNIRDRIETVLMVLIVSYAVSDWAIKDSLDSLHCQPIQKVEALEEAKARIEQYQAIVRG